MEFMSWVPTVTGQLSFTVIGRTDWPNRCVFVSKLASERPEGAVYVQDRFTHDYSLPFVGLSDSWLDFIFRKFPPWSSTMTSGSQSFFCLVDKPDTETLGDVNEISGSIIPVPWNEFSSVSVKRARERVVSAPSSIDISELQTEIVRDLKGLAPISAKFSLKRNGEFYLSVEKIEDTEDAGYGFGLISDSNLRRCAAQCYYFIRDIAHNHQHHDGKNDLIVRLHEKNDDWKRQVYFDLFRNVIHFKRIKTEFHITNASGILAYSETFRSLFLEGSEQLYQTQNTLLSLETAKYELQLKQSRAANFIALSQTMLFGLLGGIIALASLSSFGSQKARDTIIPTEWLIYLTKEVTKSPATIFVALVLLSAILAKIFGLSQPERKKYIRNTMKVFQSMPRTVNGMILLSSGFIMAVFSLWLVTH
jgi:hypothetical protein